jgi:hypothetical protein
VLRIPVRDAVWAVRCAMSSRRVLAVLVGVCAFWFSGCGENTDPKPSPPKSAASLSPEEALYLEEARRWSRSVEGSDRGKDATLLAIGEDWCRWRRSPDFGVVSESQFFDEILVEPRDGAGISRAAERHLCPAVADPPSTGAGDGSTGFLGADDLPVGFPVKQVPVLNGRIVRSETGKAAGAPPGKDAWAVELSIDQPADECFQAAVDALRAQGLKQTRTHGGGPGAQAVLTWKSLNVIVSTTEISGDCRLWYVVGPDGLRLAG